MNLFYDLRLGAFGREVVGRIALHALGFAVAGWGLVWAVTLVESANAARGLARNPEFGWAIGRFALILGGLTAGLAVARTRERLAWSAAGGHPSALLFGAVLVGAVSAAVFALGPRTVGPIGWTNASASPREPLEDLWLRVDRTLVHVEGIAVDGRRIERAQGFEASDGRLVRRWTARGLVWVGEPSPFWRAETGIERRFFDPKVGREKGDPMRTSTTASGAFGFRLRPEVLRALTAGEHAGAALRQRYGQPYRAAAFARWRRRTEPVVWCAAAAVGLGLSMLFGSRTPSIRVICAGCGTGFGLFLLDELTSGLVAVGLLEPPLGAGIAPTFTVLFTVALWRTAAVGGIRDG